MKIDYGPLCIVQWSVQVKKIQKIVSFSWNLARIKGKKWKFNVQSVILWNCFVKNASVEVKISKWNNFCSTRLMIKMADIHFNGNIWRKTSGWCEITMKSSQVHAIHFTHNMDKSGFYNTQICPHEDRQWMWSGHNAPIFLIFHFLCYTHEKITKISLT